MTELSFVRDGWIDGLLDDPDERATFTRLKITVGQAVLTRAFSTRGGGETEALNLPLLPLASYIAKMWWPLLYEPLRRRRDESFPGRHRLDLPMHGYVFPALALCSAGGDALLIDWANLENEHSPLKLLAAAPRSPPQVSRDSLEPMLMDLVESALDRLSSGSRANQEFGDNWNRVRESLENPGQSAYCMAAGRLGMDPYDPEAPDIGGLAEGLPENLFNDISDAIDVSRLAEATTWTREAKGKLATCPTIDVSAFGEPPRDDLRIAAGEVGYRAAIDLRARLGLEYEYPARAVADFLGDVAGTGSALAAEGPAPMTGLIHRPNGLAHIGTIARSARQRRFRACAGAYIAWCSEPGEPRAGTVALTRRQQAGRGFAAEMVAPSRYLFERAKNGGFTEQDIEEEAGKLIAPHETVMWQALRGGAALWDIELPPSRRNFFFDPVLAAR